MDELKAPGKPFDISKRAVWEAWEKVKANKGAPGTTVPVCDLVVCMAFALVLAPVRGGRLRPAAGTTAAACDLVPACGRLCERWAWALCAGAGPGVA